MIIYKLFKIIAVVFLLIPPTLSLAIPAPKIDARGHLLIDMNSNTVLSENNADARLEPASLTKILTAHIVFNEIKSGKLSLQDKTRVSKKAWKTLGSRMFIEVDKLVSIEELLKGLIVQSGNDAAVALAEHISGSEEAFATMMNHEALKLGMESSHFTNASGMPDDNHYTTPRDIAKVSMASIRQHPELYKWYAIKEYTYNNITQPNRNALMNEDSSVDGIKTGHTEAAGYCLVASSKRNNRRLLSVVMGSNSQRARVEATRSLIHYGYRAFETRTVLAASQVLKTVKVWKGKAEQVDLGVKENLTISYPYEHRNSVKAQLNVQTPLSAPLDKNQQVGTVIISVNDKPLKELPLITKKAVAKGGFFSGIKDSVLLWFE